MKRWVLIWIGSICFYQLPAQVLWDGEAADGLWNSPLNWSGNVLPTPSDQVVLDNSNLSGSYVVTLPSGNISVSVLKLEISPDLPNTITLINPSTNTSPTAFTATGPGDAIMLGNGALFLNASGATSGTPVSVGSANFFRINNGARYIHRTARGHTDFLVSRLSSVAGTELGVFEFDVPSTASYTVSGSNRIYGQLVLSAQASGGTKTYASSGSSALQVKSDLIIKSNVVFSYGANTSTIIVNRNCQLDANAVFNISNGANNSTVIIKGNLLNNGLITESGTSASSGLIMNGSSMQTFEGTGNINQAVQFTINNPLGVELHSHLKLPYRLTLLSGKIMTSDVSLLVLQDNATCVGGSTASFIEGPVRKIGDDAFLFPVGKGSIYAPISISGGGAVTDEFTAGYFRDNPQSSSGLGNVWQPSIHHISFVEYWSLKQDVGNSPRAVGLTVTPQSFVRVLNTLKVARFDEGIWRDEGGDGYVTMDPTPPYITGNFQSATLINRFGFFTIGTSDTYTINPLPLRLISFTNIIMGNGYCQLKWVIAAADNDHSDFEVQRSLNGSSFVTIGKVTAKNNESQYNYEDQLIQGTNSYYRLKVVDSTATVFFSPVIHVPNETMATTSIVIAPTIVGQQLRVMYRADSKEDWEWIILDLRGSILWKDKQHITIITGMKQIDVSGYKPGIYLLLVRTGSGATKVLKWVKQ